MARRTPQSEDARRPGDRRRRPGARPSVGVLLRLVGLLALEGLGSTRARAYERTTVEGHPELPLFWTGHVIALRPAYRSSTDSDPDEVRRAILRSAFAWEDAGVGCSDVQLVVGDAPSGLRTNLLGGARDGENRIVWRQAEWPHDDPDALAITTLVFNRRTGEILDADIDLNGYDFVWTTTDDPASALADVQNTVTHELGHLLGFAHTPDPTATMFDSSTPGELSKRNLASDDVDAVCTVYPSDGLSLVPPRLTGELACGVVRGAASPATTPGLLLLLAAVRLVVRRRRCPRPPRSRA